MITDTPVPEDFTSGLGELVRQMRAYLGVSQRTFGKLVGCSERALSDIEIGRRDTPRGFITSCEAVLTTFDNDVEEASDKAFQMLQGDEEQVVNFTVSADPDQEYVRAVIGRAAILEGTIVPILDGSVPKRSNNAGNTRVLTAKDSAVSFSDRGR